MRRVAGGSVSGPHSQPILLAAHGQLSCQKLADPPLAHGHDADSCHQGSRVGLAVKRGASRDQRNPSLKLAEGSMNLPGFQSGSVV